MRHGDRDSDRRAGAAQQRGYRGSYYGSDGYDDTSPSYRGVGPKGYVRSDARLQEIICEHLTDDANIDASDITVEVQDQVVHLSGSIEDRELKQEVEALIERIGGVRSIDNQLRIRSVQARPVLTMLEYDLAMLDDATTSEREPDADHCGERSVDQSPDPPER